jgi:DNA (cytosine-5)-methyltransferase 1
LTVSKLSHKIFIWGGNVAKNLSIFSFFAGSGLLDLGFEDNGYNIVFVNEFCEAFLNAYKFVREKNNYNPPKYGYSNISIEDFLSNGNNAFLHHLLKREHCLDNLTGFIGGPPCPDFSIGGKNKGRNGDNGKLTGIYFNLICDLKPDFFIFENVKGLWRTKKHRDFYEEMKKNVLDRGYKTTEQLVNAIEFGVPQDRDRILLFGVKKKLLKAKNDIENFNWNKYKKYNKETIFSLNWPIKNKFQEPIPVPKNIVNELTVSHWFSKNAVDNHYNTGDQFMPRAGLSKFESIDEGDVSKKSYKRLHRYRYSPTAAYGNNEVHIHPTEPRRLNIAEALAIQSLPQFFSLPEGMTLTQKFKTIGNGVPYLLSKGVSQSMMSFFDNFTVGVSL